MPTIRLKSIDNSVNVNNSSSTIDVAVIDRNIKLETSEQSIKLSNETQEVSVRPVSNTVSVQEVGKRGPIGPSGPANSLSIGTVVDGEDAEVTITGTAPDQTLNLVLPRGLPGQDGDKNYTAVFSPTDTLLVTHNLNKYPAVDIINTAGDEVVGNINYQSLNSLIISFSAAFGGRITCN